MIVVTELHDFPADQYAAFAEYADSKPRGNPQPHTGIIGIREGLIFPTIEGFMAYANQVIEDQTEGLGIDDFADADWSGLFEAGGGLARDADIIELLAEADDLFARMIEK